MPWSSSFLSLCFLPYTSPFPCFSFFHVQSMSLPYVATVHSCDTLTLTTRNYLLSLHCPHCLQYPLYCPSSCFPSSPFSSIKKLLTSPCPVLQSSSSLSLTRAIFPKAMSTHPVEITNVQLLAVRFTDSYVAVSVPKHQPLSIGLGSMSCSLCNFKSLSYVFFSLSVLFVHPHQIFQHLDRAAHV